MNAIATIGRPSTYRQELAERLVARVAEGAALKESCEAEGVSCATVAQWLTKHTTFAESYAQARAIQLDGFADDIITIGDRLNAPTAADVQHAKLKTDNRKWLLSKLRAEVYGDKLDVTSKGEALAAPSHQVDARVQSIVMQAAMRMQGAAALDDEAKSLLE